MKIAERPSAKCSGIKTRCRATRLASKRRSPPSWTRLRAHSASSPGINFDRPQNYIPSPFALMLAEKKIVFLIQVDRLVSGFVPLSGSSLGNQRNPAIWVCFALFQKWLSGCIRFNMGVSWRGARSYHQRKRHYNNGLERCIRIRK